MSEMGFDQENLVLLNRRIEVLSIGLSPRELKNLSGSVGFEQAIRIRSCEKIEDVLESIPTGSINLAIVSGAGDKNRIRWTLRWLKRRWPSCLNVVVGEEEQVARESGAMFFSGTISEYEGRSVLDGARQLRQAKVTSA